MSTEQSGVIDRYTLKLADKDLHSDFTFIFKDGQQAVFRNDECKTMQDFLDRVNHFHELEKEVDRLQKVIRLARDTAYQATQDCPRCGFIDNILTKALNGESEEK